MRTLQPAAETLVEGGKLRYGTYAGPFGRVNALDANVLGRVPVPRWLKAARLKEWQAFQFGSDRYFACVALFNAKTLALAQVKLYDRHTRTKALFERRLPGWALAIPDSLHDSQVEHAWRGGRIRFASRLSEGRIDIEVDVPGGRDLPAIAGAVTGLAAGRAPQVVCIPFGKDHGMYSHKCLMPVSGSLRIGKDDVAFDPQRAYLLMDDHKGYYPFTMRWDWLTAAGRQADGSLIGFNLTRNQSVDQARYNENCLWLGDELRLLPPVRFSRDLTSDPEVWRVRDDAGRIDLRFEIEMQSDLDVNALVVRSRYRGPFGHVSGRIDDVALDRLFGMGEDFYLRC